MYDSIISILTICGVFFQSCFVRSYYLLILRLIVIYFAQLDIFYSSFLKDNFFKCTNSFKNTECTLQKTRTDMTWSISIIMSQRSLAHIGSKTLKKLNFKTFLSKKEKVIFKSSLRRKLFPKFYVSLIGRIHLPLTRTEP